MVFEYGRPTRALLPLPGVLVFPAGCAGTGSRLKGIVVQVKRMIDFQLENCELDVRI